MAHIILVEPDKLLGQTYQTALSMQGYSVRWCQTAQSAIQAVDERRPDLLIVELQLPMHNGVEFLYELRSYSDWLSLPVIILSHISPLRKSFGMVQWEQLSIRAYHYKPLTKLSDLIRSTESILHPLT